MVTSPDRTEGGIVAAGFVTHFFLSRQMVDVEKITEKRSRADFGEQIGSTTRRPRTCSPETDN